MVLGENLWLLEEFENKTYTKGIKMKSKNDFECKICGVTEFNFDVRKSDYTYVVCAGCGTSIIYPLPTERILNEFYERYFEDGGNYLQTRELDKNVYFNDYDKTFSDLFFELKPQWKYLDVGCATGIFLDYLKEKKCVNTKGIDVSSEMIENANRKGLNCTTEDLLSLNQKFNIITLWDVLEHFIDPKQSLEKVHQLLEKDGNLIIQTPCRGIISQQLKDEWRHYNPPQHIYLFNQNSLFKLLTSTNFMIVNWIRIGSGNTAGTISPNSKKVFDNVSKNLGIGDNIIVWAKRRD